MGTRRAVVILGGDGKGQDFSPLKAAVEANARAVLLIGRDAPLIAAAIDGSGIDTYPAASLQDAVEQAQRLAHAGDAVLLSPACASFDMFRNYIAPRRSVRCRRCTSWRRKGQRLMLYSARAPKPSTELDFSLLWLALGLLSLGLVMVYSASIAIAEAAKYTGHNGEYYLLRQGMFIAVGIGGRHQRLPGADAGVATDRALSVPGSGCCCWWWC